MQFSKIAFSRTSQLLKQFYKSLTTYCISLQPVRTQCSLYFRPNHFLLLIVGFFKYLKKSELGSRTIMSPLFLNDCLYASMLRQKA